MNTQHTHTCIHITLTFTYASTHASTFTVNLVEVKVALLKMECFLRSHGGTNTFPIFLRLRLSHLSFKKAGSWFCKDRSWYNSQSCVHGALTVLLYTGFPDAPDTDHILASSFSLFLRVKNCWPKSVGENIVARQSPITTIFGDCLKFLCLDLAAETDLINDGVKPY